MEGRFPQTFDHEKKYRQWLRLLSFSVAKACLATAKLALAIFDRRKYMEHAVGNGRKQCLAGESPIRIDLTNEFS